jgi:hypothetical protein
MHAASVEDVGHVAICKHGRWPPRAMNAPTSAKTGKSGTAMQIVTILERLATPCHAVLDSCGRDVDVAGGQGVCG